MSLLHCGKFKCLSQIICLQCSVPVAGEQLSMVHLAILGCHSMRVWWSCPTCFLLFCFAFFSFLFFSFSLVFVLRLLVGSYGYCLMLDMSHLVCYVEKQVALIVDLLMCLTNLWAMAWRFGIHKRNGKERHSKCRYGFWVLCLKQGWIL